MRREMKRNEVEERDSSRETREEISSQTRKHGLVIHGFPIGLMVLGRYSYSEM